MQARNVGGRTAASGQQGPAVANFVAERLAIHGADGVGSLQAATGCANSVLVKTAVRTSNDGVGQGDERTLRRGGEETCSMRVLYKSSGATGAGPDIDRCHHIIIQTPLYCGHTV